jgi:uncharacterized protein YdaU (DUF1376 family)
MDLPEPPVPPECSMSGNDWMPLHFGRLRKSKWWRRASDLARARNVMLWGEAYQSTPAGSLPDDDDELAEAAGFGMEVEAFIAVKAEIMSPWTLCADGRWYHPTVCEVVLATWEKASDRRKRAAEKKAEQRAKARGQALKTRAVPAKTADVPRDIAIVPDDIAKNDRDIRTEERRGEDIRVSDANASSVASATDEPELRLDGAPKRDDVREAFDLWNETARECGLPIARSLDADRRKLIAARLKVDGLDGWREVLAAVAKSGYHRGENDRGWKAGIDFICRPDKYRSLREGVHGQTAKAATNGAATPPAAAWAGPPDILAACNHYMPEAAPHYLPRCRYREDGGARTLSCPTGVIFDRIRRDAGDELRSMGVNVVHEPVQ